MPDTFYRDTPEYRRAARKRRLGTLLMYVGATGVIANGVFASLSITGVVVGRLRW